MKKTVAYLLSFRYITLFTFSIYTDSITHNQYYLNESSLYLLYTADSWMERTATIMVTHPGAIGILHPKK